MRMKSLASSLAAATLVLGGTPAMAAERSAAMVSNTCAGCHGTDGVSKGEAPTIAGLPEEYLKTAMQSYKDGTRYSTIMGRIAKGYSTAEIEAMAGFFAAREWHPAEQETDADLVARGGKLHNEKLCAGCHGPKGTATNPTIPNMAGQYAEYLYFQMKDYANPERAIPASAMAMRPMFKGLTDEDLKALAHFYASQR